ncbi:MAG: hypothetical protein ACOYON_07055 [Fimbriimonas sp.]
MKDKGLYHKLVDMYAGRELPEELEKEMEAEAFADPGLDREMTTLRRTVDTLRGLEAPEFTEETYQRILMKVYARGGDVQSKAPQPSYLQYQLPIQG